MLKTLEHFGFGENSIDWIKIFKQSGILLNKWRRVTTHYFKLGKDTRQRDRISAYLFNEKGERLRIFENTFLFTA